jgi:hypothetical protein
VIIGLRGTAVPGPVGGRGYGKIRRSCSDFGETIFIINFENPNLLGKLVFELEHTVAFEDEDRFGPLKILDYLHDKVFKMLGLYTLVERLCMHDG